MLPKLTPCSGLHLLDLDAMTELISGDPHSLVFLNQSSPSPARHGATTLLLTQLITKPGENLMEMDLLNPVNPINLMEETCGMLAEDLDLDLAPVEVEVDPLQEPGIKTGTMTDLSLMLIEIDLIGEVSCI